MEHMDAMVDLIRALSKRCEDFEYHKRQHDYYYKWYNELQEEVDRLREILQNAGIEH